MQTGNPPLELDLQVRFRDLDASGHLNHATIIRFIEDARLAYYEQVLGMAIPSDLTFWVLAEISVSYRAAGRFGDRLRAGIRIPWVKRSSAGWEFSLTRTSDDTLIAEGKGVHVHIDPATGRGSEIPARWRECILNREGLGIAAGILAEGSR